MKRHPQWLKTIEEKDSGTLSNPVVIDAGLIDGKANDTNKGLWSATMNNGLLIEASSVIIKNLVLANLHVGVDIRGDNVTIDGWGADTLSGDVIQGEGNNARILNGTCRNLISVLPYNKYHPDVIHFRNGSGGLIDGLQVIPSDHKWARKDYQGCMFSDSSFDGWAIRNLKLPGVHPEHAVTFAEAHDCCVESVWGGGAVRFRDLNGIKSTGCKTHNIDGPVSGGMSMIDIDGIMKKDEIGFSVPAAPENSIDTLIRSTAERLGIEPELLEALIEQESLKAPFHNGFPTILFERHIFTQLLNNNGVDINKLLAKMPEAQDIIGYRPYSKYGSYSKQQQRYELACRVSDEIAIGACSWGAFSVMGMWWEKLGLSSAQELAEKARTIEGQFELMIGYMENVEPRALDALRAKDFESFKHFYNGPGKNDYAAELAQKYRRALARSQPKKTIKKGKSRTINTQVIDGGQKVTLGGGLFAMYYSLKDQLAVLKDEVAQMGWQEWVIVAVIVYMLWPNIRTFFTYLHDNGFMPRKDFFKHR